MTWSSCRTELQGHRLDDPVGVELLDRRVESQSMRIDELRLELDGPSTELQPERTASVVDRLGEAEPAGADVGHEQSLAALTQCRRGDPSPGVASTIAVGWSGWSDLGDHETVTSGAGGQDRVGASIGGTGSADQQLRSDRSADVRQRPGSELDAQDQR